MELKSGVLVCAVGVPIREQACFRRPACPRNGNYLAFSRDGGASWNHVVQLASVVWTTHYVGLSRDPTESALRDLRPGFWGRPNYRIMGCTVDVSVP